MTAPWPIREVFLNGEEIAAHKDGYTPFEVRLTGRLKPGDNLVTVKIDGSENPEIPPFGGRIDYLTYAGIYRDVWLRVTAPVSIANVKIETPDVLASRKSVRASVAIANPQNLTLAGTVAATLRDADGRVIASASAPVAATVLSSFDDLADIALWDIDNPGALHPRGRTRGCAMR